MKKIFIFTNIFFMLFLLAGCTSDKEDIKNTISIEVYDIDTSLLEEKTIRFNKNDKLLDLLTSNFDVDYEMSSYGAYIKSINNSIIDKNYFVALYENDVLSDTSIDGIILDDKDKFSFKVECFSGFDEIDLLVDKTIYSFYKQSLTKLKDTTDLSNYWLFMGYNDMLGSGYDNNLFNKEHVNDSLISNLNSMDIDTLDLFKYYYTSQVCDIDLSKISSKFDLVLKDFDKLTQYNLPFYLSLAKVLNKEEGVRDYINKKIYDTTYGIDSISWHIASNAIYNDVDADSLYDGLIDLENEYINNPTTLLGVAAAFCSVSKNPREYSEFDIIKHVMDNFYDEDTKLLCELNSFSDSQIYTYLVAYKILRDSNEAFNYLY